MWRKAEAGFSLVELMVTLAVMGIILSAVFLAYRSQERSYDLQEQVVGAQQGVRVASLLMAKEIRMAGYDPLGTANATIVTALPGRIQFTADITEDGDTADANEDIAFGFPTAVDGDNDGLPTGGVASLGRNTGGGYMPIVENIEAISFEYGYDSNGDGDLDAWSYTPPAANLGDIMSIRVAVLARADKPDARYTNTNTYTVGHNVINANDRFRRRLTNFTVHCRNMGL